MLPSMNATVFHLGWNTSAKEAGLQSTPSITPRLLIACTTFKFQSTGITVIAIFHGGLYAGYLIHQSVMANKLVYAISEYGGQPGFNDWDLGGQCGVQFVLNDNNGLIIDFSQSILPIRDNPAQTNQYSFYEGGNYNSTLSLAWLHTF